MNREALVILEKFNEVFDNYNDKKITKEQMLESCKRLHKKLPLSWKTKDKKETKKEGRVI